MSLPFHIESIRETEPGKIEAEIILDASHPIFKGHFPGHPILPGVISMRILREILAQHLNGSFDLAEASNIRFTKVINPEEEKSLRVHLQYERAENADVHASAQMFLRNEQVARADKLIYRTFV